MTAMTARVPKTTSPGTPLARAMTAQTPTVQTIGWVMMRRTVRAMTAPMMPPMNPAMMFMSPVVDGVVGLTTAASGPRW